VHCGFRGVAAGVDGGAGGALDPLFYSTIDN